MADDIISPVDLGFAEFVAKLISEVFDAIVSSQAEQQEKLSELESLLLQPDDVFLDAFLVKDEFVQEIELILQAYFPSTEEGQVHAIYEGGIYQPEKVDQPETPPIKEKLGLELTSGDFKPRARVLTEQGVIKIYRKAAEPLAAQRRTILKQMVEGGMPKILVDSGKINAKLTFSANQIGKIKESPPKDLPSAVAKKFADDSTPKAEKLNADRLISGSSRLVAAKDSPKSINFSGESIVFADRKKYLLPIQPINRYVGLIKPNLNEQVRLTVKPASNKSPQDTQAQTNIYSEVEINFKAIS